MKHYIGVDVGTGSARAGVFDHAGKRLSTANKAIRVSHPKPGFVEQSTQDIWQAICDSVRRAVTEANITRESVSGIGFDATCSVTVMDRECQPLPASPGGDSFWDVIVWMDHRAMAQADRINATKHKTLNLVGGKISPEMQTPKLLWLKENHPELWEKRGHFLGLPNWLIWRATGFHSKEWSYFGYESQWDKDYFKTIGLDELVTDNPDTSEAGTLTLQAANKLGLHSGTPVGIPMVDALAGGLGVLGAGSEEQTPDFEKRVALVSGTSSCHITVSKEARTIPGLWGPHLSTMVPGMWLNEGGQSATGSLVDHIVFNHHAAAELHRQGKEEGKSIYCLLNERLLSLAGSENQIPFLTRDIHVLPYFHGNRSPRVDPRLTGMMTGLKLSASADDLALQYLATIQAIAMGTRHIIETLNDNGYAIDTIMACGGGTKNQVFLQAHANATGCTIQMAEEEESVLLGSAMLGAVAAGEYRNISSAMAGMSRIGRKAIPGSGKTAEYYEAKYKVFMELYEDQQKYKAIMNS